MNSIDFNKIVEDRINKIRNVLASKGAEYSNDDNKLHNFDKAARMSGQTREQALKGMLLKHEVSISDIIEKTAKGIYPSIEVINEKIGDIINYYILLEACLVQRAEGKSYPEYKIKQMDIQYPLTFQESFKIPEEDSISVEGQHKENRIFYLRKSDRHIFEVLDWYGENYKIKACIIKEGHIIPTGTIIPITKLTLDTEYESWKQEDS